MSNYHTKAKRPDGESFEDVEMLDDYFGRHRYGVRFSDGVVYKEEECEFIEEYEDEELEAQIKAQRKAKFPEMEK